MQYRTLQLLWPLLAIFLLLNPAPARVQAADDEASSTEGYNKPYKFSENWFADKMPVWREILKEFKGKPNVTYLEVGTFEGRSSLWLLENILTHPSSKIWIIDAFQENTFDTFASNINLSGEADKFKILAGYSTEKLKEIPFSSIDFSYIDGSGKGIVMLSDLVNVWNLTKLNGIIMCSRYSLDSKLREVLKLQPQDPGPHEAIDAFVKIYRPYIDIVLFEENYVIIRKIRD